MPGLFIYLINQYHSGVKHIFILLSHFVFFTVFIVPRALAVEDNECNAANIQAEQKISLYRSVLKSNKKNTFATDVALGGSSLTQVKQYTYKVIARIPHSILAFTQGLVIYNGSLYEGTGGLGRSEIRQLDIKTGELIKAQKTDRAVFGEGISVSGNQLFQLGWKSERAQIYDLHTFSKTGEYRYKGEGWGVTLIGAKLLVSDGSSSLRWFDYSAGNHKLENQALYKKVSAKKTDEGNHIKVRESGVEIQGINELEYANGFIYANILPTDCIAEIDPETGDVRAWINLSGLNPRESRRHWEEVLNGIAYHQEKGFFYVTGKYWPYIYIIKLVAPGV